MNSNPIIEVKTFKILRKNCIDISVYLPCMSYLPNTSSDVGVPNFQVMSGGVISRFQGISRKSLKPEYINDNIILMNEHLYDCWGYYINKEINGVRLEFRYKSITISNVFNFKWLNSFIASRYLSDIRSRLNDLKTEASNKESVDIKTYTVSYEGDKVDLI